MLALLGRIGYTLHNELGVFNFSEAKMGDYIGEFIVVIVLCWIFFSGRED